MGMQIGRRAVVRLATVLSLSQSVAVAAQSSPVLVTRIGADARGRDYEFGEVVGVEISTSGEIFVLDRMNREVRVFNTDGEFQRRFGREGSGPAEFMLPSRLMIAGNRVRVFDARLQRLVIFDLQGKHIETIRAPQEGGAIDFAVPMRHNYWLGVKATTRIDSRAITELARSPRAEKAQRSREYRAGIQSFVVAYKDGQAEVDTLVRFDAGAIFWFKKNVGLPTGFLRGNFGSEVEWTISGDSLAAFVNTFTGGVRILKVQPHDIITVRTGAIPVAEQHISDSEVNELVKKEQQAGIMSRVDVDVVSPAKKAVLGPALFADDGSLWVSGPASADTKAASHFRIIPTDGTAQRSVTLPAALRLYSVRSGLVAGTRRTELDVDVVELWRIAGAR